MAAEINFSGASLGKFFKEDAQLNLPVYLELQVQTRLADLATDKGVDLSMLGNTLLRKEIELLAMGR